MINLLTKYNADGGGADSGCSWSFLGRRIIDSSDALVGGVDLSVDGVTASYNIGDSIGTTDNPLVDFLEFGYEYHTEYSCIECGDTEIVVWRHDDCCDGNDPGVEFQYDGTCLEILPIGVVSDTTSDSIEWRKPGGSYQAYTGPLCGCDIFQTFDVTASCEILTSFGSILMRIDNPTFSCSGVQLRTVTELYGNGETSFHTIGTGLNEFVSGYIPNDWVNLYNRQITLIITADTPIGTLIQRVTYTYTGSVTSSPSCSNIQITKEPATVIFYEIEARRTVNYANCPQSQINTIWEPPQDCIIDLNLRLCNVSFPDPNDNFLGICTFRINCDTPDSTQWFFNGNPIPSDSTNGVNRETHGFGTYEAIITCGDCSATASLVYQEDCTVSVSISPSGSTLTANPVGCSGSVSYSWTYFDGTTITPLPDTTQSITATQTGTYIVNITCDGCAASDSHFYQVPCNLNVTIDPQVTNGITEFNSTLLNCSGGPTYTWDLLIGGSWFFRGSGTSYTPTESGTYRLTVVCDDGCSDTDTETYSIAPCGTVSIQANGCDFTSTINGFTNPSYTWQIDNNGTWEPAGGTLTTFTGLHGKRYRLRVVDLSNSCESFSNVVNGDCQGSNCNCGATLIYDSANCRFLIDVTGTTCGTWFLRYSVDGSNWTTRVSGTGTVSTIFNIDQNGMYRIEYNGTGTCPSGQSPPRTATCVDDPCDIFSAGINGDSLVCVDSNVTLVATTSNGLGAYGYSWSHGGGTNQIAMFTRDTIGTINYSVTITDLSTGCIDTAFISVTYEACADPCENFSAQIIGFVNVCGDSTGLLATSSGGAGNPEYLWSTGQTTQGITVGSGAYSVVVTDGLCSANDDITVSVQPPVTVNVGSNRIANCGTNSISLNATVGGLNPGGMWSSTGNGFFDSNNPSTNYNIGTNDPGSTIILTYTIPAFNNCPAVSDSLDLTIRPCCTLSVNIEGTTDVCGSSTNLVARASDNNGNVSYLWNTGATTRSILGTGSGTMTFFVDVTDDICTVRATITVTFSGLNMSMAGPDVSVCEGQSVLMSANTPPPGTLGVWQGYGSGTMSDFNSPTAEFTPSESQAGTIVGLVWRIVGEPCPDGTDTVVVTVIEDTSTLQLDCSQPPVDYLFLLDTSGSISTIEWNDMRESIRATIDLLELNDQNKRYSIVQYGTDPPTNQIQVDVNSTSSASVAKNFNRASIGIGDHLNPTMDLIINAIDNGQISVRSNSVRKMLYFSDASNGFYIGPNTGSTLRPFDNMNSFRSTYGYEVSCVHYNLNTIDQGAMASNTSVGGPYTGGLYPNPSDPQGTQLPRRLYVRSTFTGGAITDLAADVDDSCLLSVNNTPSGSTFLWNTGAETSSIGVGLNDGQTYTVDITTPQGCTFTKTFNN